MTSHVTLVLKKTSGQLCFVDSEGNISEDAPEGVKVNIFQLYQPLLINTEEFYIQYHAISTLQVLVDRKNPYNLAPTSPGAGAEVVKLDHRRLIPDARIDRMITGPVENFRVKCGFVDKTCKPERLTLALWCQFESQQYKSHEFIMGGPKLQVNFSMKKMFGTSGRNEDTEVSAEIDPSALRFRRCSSVTNWKTF